MFYTCSAEFREFFFLTWLPMDNIMDSEIWESKKEFLLKENLVSSEAY